MFAALSGFGCFFPSEFVEVLSAGAVAVAAASVALLAVLSSSVIAVEVEELDRKEVCLLHSSFEEVVDTFVLSFFELVVVIFLFSMK